VNTISSQAASEKDKDKNKEEADVNIDELLFDLKKDIIKVHGSTNKQSSDLHAKSTLDILTVSYYKSIMNDYRKLSKP